MTRDAVVRERLSRGWGGMAVAALLALGSACSGRANDNPPRHPPSMNDGTRASEYPVVRAAVNMQLGAVVTASSYHIDLSAVLDNSSKIIADPVVFEYLGEAGPRGLAFRMPPSRYVALTQFGGWVYSITVTPQLGAGSLAEAVTALNETKAALASSAWRPSTACGATSDPSAPAAWADPEASALLAACYIAGDAELRVMVERDRAPARDLARHPESRDSFFVSVEVSDVSRLERYQKYTFARRRAAHGSIAQPLPVTAVLGDATPP